MKKLFVIVVVIVLVGMVLFVMVEDCGMVIVVEMNWVLVGVIVYIDKIIFENGYGCNVELVIGDMMLIFIFMNEKGELDMVFEFWINVVCELFDKVVVDGFLIIGGEIFNEGGVEGFWVLIKVVEEYDIYIVKVVMVCLDFFKGVEDDSKGGFFICLIGWNCCIIIGNLFCVYGFDEVGFELVDLGFVVGFDGFFVCVNECDEGWFGYYWVLIVIFGKYDMILLDFEVLYDKVEWDKCMVVEDCLELKLNFWVKFEVFIVVIDDFVKKVGLIMDYVKGCIWDNWIVGKVLVWMMDN